MEPAIGRSLGQGFRVANRSWAAVGFVAGCGLVVGLLVSQSGSSKALATTVQREIGNRQTPTTPLSQQLTESIKTFWPGLLGVALLTALVNVWLVGGQLGYVAKHIRRSPVRVAEVWQNGTRVFLKLVGAVCLGSFVIFASAIMFALLVILVRVLPFIGELLAPLVVLAGLLGLIWIVVRCGFWHVAIAVDRLGPIAGVGASFRATGGRWWPVCGLALLAGLITLTVALPMAILQGITRAVGGEVGGFVMTLVSAAATTYIGFAVAAAFIQFYEDVKTEGRS